MGTHPGAKVEHVQLGQSKNMCKVSHANGVNNLKAPLQLQVCYQMRPAAHDAVIAFKVQEQLEELQAAQAPDCSPLRRAVLTHDRVGDVAPAVPMLPMSPPRAASPRPS
jgi:hypothetical protein